MGEMCLKSYNMHINIPDSTNKLLKPAIGPTPLVLRLVTPTYKCDANINGCPTCQLTI